MIVKRITKGSALTHAELDNNFTELESSISSKANSTDVFTKSESNSNYAAKAGSTSQVFSVDTATLPDHAPTLAQLDASKSFSEKVNRYNLFDIAGTANDIELTLQVDRIGVTAVEDGVEVNFVALANNTGPVIVTVNFGTSTMIDIPITKLGATPLVANDIVAGAAYKLIFDGTGFQIFGGVGGAVPPVDLSNYYTKAEVDTEVSKSRIPVGFIFAYPTLSVPVGYLRCEAQFLLKADYPDLYAAIGDIYFSFLNPNPALYFSLPDIRGEFLRGADNGRWVDNSPVKAILTNGSNILTSFDSFGSGYGLGVRISGNGIPAGTTITAINIFTGTVTLSNAATLTTSVQVPLTMTGRAIGTPQNDTIKRHRHKIGAALNNGTYLEEFVAAPGLNTVTAVDGSTDDNGFAYYKSDETGTGSGETRGRNLAVCYCIKAFDTIVIPAEVEIDAFVTTKISDALAAYDITVDAKITAALPSLKMVAAGDYNASTEQKDLLGNITYISYSKNISTNEVTYVFEIANVGKAFTSNNFVVDAHGYNVTYGRATRVTDNRFTITGFYPDNGADAYNIGIEFTVTVAV